MSRNPKQYSFRRTIDQVMAVNAGVHFDMQPFGAKVVETLAYILPLDVTLIILYDYVFLPCTWCQLHTVPRIRWKMTGGSVDYYCSTNCVNNVKYMMAGSAGCIERIGPFFEVVRRRCVNCIRPIFYGSYCNGNCRFQFMRRLELQTLNDCSDDDMELEEMIDLAYMPHDVESFLQFKSSIQNRAIVFT